MMKLHCTPLVLLLTIVLSNAGIRAENETRDPTKSELCEETHGKCLSTATLLQQVAFKTNNEAMGLKLSKESLEFDKRDINREIKILRHRLENPSSPPLNLPVLGRSGVGLGVIGFRFPEYNNCTSVFECLNLLQGIKSYWTGLEEMKTNYTSQINILQSEKNELINLRENLKKQITSAQNNS